MPAAKLEFRILGPLSVRVDGNPVPVGGPKQRALLALLLLSANRVVSRERLIEELFVEQSLTSRRPRVAQSVSRLRKVLAQRRGDEPRLVARAPGYLLQVEPASSTWGASSGWSRRGGGRLPPARRSRRPSR